MLLKTIPIGILIILCACSGKTDQTVTVSKNGSEKTYTLHIKEIKDTLSLKLSDIASDFEFIPLETNEECYIGYGTYYVTNDYVLARKEGYGLLQFERSGKFIRTILTEGQGPNEYLIPGWSVDEKNQILYLTDFIKKNYILRYDLHTGVYLGDLKKAISCYSHSIHINPDNSLIVVPFGAFKDINPPSYLYWQNLDGSLIDRIEAPDTIYKSGDPKSFYTYNGIPRYQFMLYDTVYAVHEKQLIPYLVFDFGEENPRYSTIGRKTMILQFETDQWISIANFYIDKQVIYDGEIESTSGKMAFYILDKKEDKLFHQGRVYFDPSNHYRNANVVEDELQVQENGIFHYAYQAVSLIELSEKAFEDPNFKDPYRSKLKEIVGKISENDNPILLIGKAKL